MRFFDWRVLKWSLCYHGVRFIPAEQYCEQKGFTPQLLLHIVAGDNDASRLLKTIRSVTVIPEGWHVGLTVQQTCPAHLQEA
jgi:hypothetical protein